MGLITLKFDTEDMKLNTCFTNEELIKVLHEESPEGSTLPKVQEVFGELRFPKAPEGRPYTFSSMVLSSDGKMAYEDNPEGPIISRNNFLDPNGALADFWVLNVLRAYADGCITGARTLQAEPMNSSHVFDAELFEQRKSVLGKERYPVNIIVSFDATDIPLDHHIFSIDDPEFAVMIATSPDGLEYIRKHSSFPIIPITASEDASLDTIIGMGLSGLCEEHDIDPESSDAFNDLVFKDQGIPVIVTGEGSNPDAQRLMKLLRSIGMERLLIESPSYASHLMRLKALDEFFLNYSMVFVGGRFTPNSSGPFSCTEHPHARLVTLATHESSFMFTRQKLDYRIGPNDNLDEYEY